METLGDAIKQLREDQDLPLRKVAAYIDVDQAILSKIEHGIRRPKREQVIQLAKYFKVDEKPLLVKWLAEKILDELNDDELSLDAISLAKLMIKDKQSGTIKAGAIDYLKLGEGEGMESMFHGERLPSYIEFARYLINTATKEKFNEHKINTETGLIGEDGDHEIYLFYKPNQDWLKNNALTLNMIRNLPDYKGKKRLVFASLKYVDDETCRLHHIEFGKIPY